MKKSQILSYAKTTKKYYCSTCITQNVPFNKVPTNKLNMLNCSDHIVNNSDASLNQRVRIQDEDLPCNLCLECNPECSSCLNNACNDPRRICETCLICNYVIDNTELNKIGNDFSSKFQSSLTAIHFNARSLQKHYKAICDLLAESSTKFDIIGISETKFIDEDESTNDSCISDSNVDLDVSKIQIEGYQFEHTPTNFAFGGAGLYVSKKLDFVFRPDLKFKIDSCETCFFELKSNDNKQKSTIVGVIYRHPHDNHSEFFLKLQSVAESILKKSNLIILGDTNIDISANNTCLHAKTYQDILLGLDLKNIISRPTRITNTSATIIDHIITNLP